MDEHLMLEHNSEQRSLAFREQGDAKCNDQQYSAANLSYLNALVLRPDDTRTLLQMSLCFGELGNWHKSAEAAWHCMHLCNGSSRAIESLTRALISLKLPQAAFMIIQRERQINPGNQDLARLRRELSFDLGSQRSLPDSLKQHLGANWYIVAEFLDDRTILKLTSAAAGIRGRIFLPSMSSPSSSVALSKHTAYSRLWQHYPSWAVSMLVHESSRVHLLSDFMFSSSHELRQFLYAAYIVNAWADLHDGSSVAFAVYEFGLGVLRNFLRTPVVEGEHSICSASVEIMQNISTLLELTDNASTVQTDGFSLSLSADGFVRSKKIVAASFVHGQFVVLKSDVGGGEYDVKTVYEGTPLFEAILEGRPLPFMVALL